MTLGGGGTDDGSCLRTHRVEGLGACFPRKILASEIASEVILYPNATSPTIVHSRSNTAVRYDTRQSSRAFSHCSRPCNVRVGPDEVGIL